MRMQRLESAVMGALLVVGLIEGGCWVGGRRRAAAAAARRGEGRAAAVVGGVGAVGGSTGKAARAKLELELTQLPLAEVNSDGEVTEGADGGGWRGAKGKARPAQRWWDSRRRRWRGNQSGCGAGRVGDRGGGHSRWRDVLSHAASGCSR